MVSCSGMERVAGVTLGVLEDAKPRGFAAIYQDGARVTGDLVKVDEGGHLAFGHGSW